MPDHLVLGICGSLRRGSFNAALLDLAQSVGTRTTVVGGDLAGRLPLFNPDVENDEDSWPEAVREFRELAERAEGVIIATPEYAHGPAGVTKNAIDWLVGSGGLVGRPTLLVSASPGQAGGMRAHAPLMPTPHTAGRGARGLRGGLAGGVADERPGRVHRPLGGGADATGRDRVGGGPGVRRREARPRPPGRNVTALAAALSPRRTGAGRCG